LTNIDRPASRLVKKHKANGYWNYIKIFTRKDVVSKINAIVQVKTDLGRGQ
jgi:hypothetical protein